MNHSATFRHELSGGYLWSPKREKFARSQFYDNMRRVRPGDLVLSYINGKVGHLGVATDGAVDAQRPEEFGPSGEAWSREGWVLPVLWTALPESVLPRSIWEALRPMLPQKYSPLVLATGYGSQKAYLSEIGEAAFDLIMSAASATRPDGGVESTIDYVLGHLEDGIERGLLETSQTERQQLVLARRGQGIFRANVMKYERACRLTGLETAHLLNASHIKPWRSCSNGTERLDGDNGLLLTPNVDRLFDRGLMTFAPDGAAIFSTLVSSGDLHALGLSESLTTKPRPFRPQQLTYLAFHRETIFHA